MSPKSFIAALFILPSLALAQTEYVVHEGDTLLKIADRSLGNTDRNNPRRYEFVKRLIQMNPNIKNPNALEPGQTLILPADAEAKMKTQAKPAPTPHENITEPVIVLKPAPTAHAQNQQQVPTTTTEETGQTTAQTTPVVIVETPAAAPAHAQSPQEEPHAQAPAEAAQHETHDKSAHHNFFFAQPRAQMIELTSKNEATHTKAKMESESSVGLDLQYGYILNDRFHLLFQGGITNTQFSKLKGVAASVNHRSETLKSFSAGIAYEVSKTVHVDLMALYAEHTFLLPHAPGEYHLEAIALPGAELNLSWDFYSRGSNIFGVSAIGEYLGTVKKEGVEYKSTLEPIGALYWKSNYGHERLNYKVTLMYKHGHQETSLAKKYEDLTTLGLGFYF